MKLMPHSPRKSEVWERLYFWDGWSFAMMCTARHLPVSQVMPAIFRLSAKTRPILGLHSMITTQIVMAVAGFLILICFLQNIHARAEPGHSALKVRFVTWFLEFSITKCLNTCVSDINHCIWERDREREKINLKNHHLVIQTWYKTYFQKHVTFSKIKLSRLQIFKMC